MCIVTNVKNLIVNISMRSDEELENLIYDFIEENENGVFNQVAQGNKRITVNSLKSFILNNHLSEMEINEFIEFYISVKEFSLRSLDCGIMNLNRMLFFQDNYFEDSKFINRCQDQMIKNLVSSIIIIEDKIYVDRKIKDRQDILSKTEIGRDILKIVNC